MSLEYYKLGVSAKSLENNSSFQFGRSISTSLSRNSDAFMGNNRVYFYYTNPYAPQLVRPGDRIIFGPSTYPGYETIREGAIINSVNSYYIELTSSLENFFNAGDEVSGIGSVLAVGWSLGGRQGLDFYPGNLWYPLLGISYPHNELYSSGGIWQERFGGYVDNYRQYLQWDVADGSGNGANNPTFYRDYGDVLLGNTYYRLGFFSRGSFGADTLKVELHDGNGYVITAQSILAATNAKMDWKENTFTGITSSSPNGSVVKFYNNDVVAPRYLFIDDIYLEHAKYTDGNNDGVYTFTEFPEADSEKIFPVAETSFVLERSPSGKGFTNQESGTGDRVKKYVITMDFANVSPEFYQNIKKLERWQEYGYNLILHPTTFVSLHSKPVLYGKMSISGVSYLMWDRSRVSFTFTFEEI